MSRWIGHLLDLQASATASVLVTVATVRGSAPREPGAKMIVTEREVLGSVGGGQLEYQCSRIATDWLAKRSSHSVSFVRKFPLGSNCGQCCGGVVTVLFEAIDGSPQWLSMLQALRKRNEPVVVATALTGEQQKFLIHASHCASISDSSVLPENVVVRGQQLLGRFGETAELDGYLLESVTDSDLQIAVFGAGHVGAATVDVVSRLEARVHWIDSRPQALPDRLPENVIALRSPEPAAEVARMPVGACYLVMTHSHPLDLSVCEKVLQRDDFAYCGLIGSLTKRRRFDRLLGKQGISAAALGRLTCPIGIEGIVGKTPAEIAVSVAAQLLMLHNARWAITDDWPLERSVRQA